MTLRKEEYVPRHVDDRIAKLLTLFGAVAINGPKWCGKTWTAYNCCNSAFLLQNPDGEYNNKSIAITNPSMIFSDNPPQLIDEWQDAPSIWDAVRYHIDNTASKGLFVLTGSTKPRRKGYQHSGTGRIRSIDMGTMTLMERGISDGSISILGLFDHPNIAKLLDQVNLKEIIEYTVHGGWPGTMKFKSKDSLEIARGYIDTLLNEDISNDGKSRNKNTMHRLIRSLARNESTTASKKTLRSDMREGADDSVISENTLDDYLQLLEDLYFVVPQPAFDPNMRSSIRVGKTPKRHLADPSLACAALGATAESLFNDLNTFGYIFEALCVHDLRIYASVFDGTISHYRDGDGREIDAILELPDQRWGAFEIKVGAHEIDNGAKSLLRMKAKIEEQENGRIPEFLCVICGMSNAAYVRPDGVYVLPPTVLGP